MTMNSRTFSFLFGLFFALGTLSHESLAASLSGRSTPEEEKEIVINKIHFIGLSDKLDGKKIEVALKIPHQHQNSLYSGPILAQPIPLGSYFSLNGDLKLATKFPLTIGDSHRVTPYLHLSAYEQGTYTLTVSFAHYSFGPGQVPVLTLTKE